MSDVRDLAPLIAERLKTVGAARVIHEPGNGSRYDTTLALVDEHLVGYTGFITLYGPLDVTVALPEWGVAYTFDLAWEQDAGYLGEKLFNGNEVDGAAMAELLNLVGTILRDGAATRPQTGGE